MFSILVALKVRQHKIFPSVRSPRLPTSRRTLGLPNPSPGSRGLQSSATHCPCGSVTAHLFGMISGDPCYLCPPCSMPGFWSHHHYHFEGYLWHVISWISKPDESDLEIVCPIISILLMDNAEKAGKAWGSENVLLPWVPERENMHSWLCVDQWTYTFTLACRCTHANTPPYTLSGQTN